MDRELCLEVAEDGADAERLSVLVRYLRDEIRRLGVEVVARRGTPPPPGTRAFDPVATAELVVVLGQSAVSMGSVVVAVRGWLRRGDQPGRTVRIRVGGDVLHLTNATAAEQQRLVDMFVARHAAGVDDG